MSNSIIAQLFCWLCDGSKPKSQLVFSTVSVEGIVIEGNIKMVKFEFNQSATFTASPLDRHGNPAQIQAGSATWTVQAQDADGNPVDLHLVVNPDNELEATLTSGDVEATGAITLRADGDPDANEEFPIIGTADIVVDSPNAVVFSLANTEPADV